MYAYIYIPVRKGLGFPGGSVVKNLLAYAGDMGSIPLLGRSPGEGNGNPLQYFCLVNPRGTWWASAHGVTKESDTTERLKNNSSTIYLFFGCTGSVAV